MPYYNVEERRRQEALPPKKPDYYCNAKKKQGGGYCRNRAGWKTEHPGEGRCRLHGGAGSGRPVMGMSQRVAKSPKYRKRFEEVLERGGLWDMDRVVAHHHVLYEDWVDRYDALEGAERAEAVIEGRKIIESLGRVIQKRQSLEVQGALMKSDWQRALKWLLEDVEEVLLEVGRSGPKYSRDQVLPEAKERWRKRFEMLLLGGRKGRAR